MSSPRAWFTASRLIPTAAAVTMSFAGCGTDVNLGGTANGGTTDAGSGIEELVDICEPCATAQSCPVGATCALIAGSHAFCATVCPRGTECDVDDVCELLPLGGGVDTVRACVPKTGACELAKPPASDGAPLEHCGSLEAPSIAAACKSCDKDDSDCQKNGCYGGWWCNTTTTKCQRPPANCP